MPIDATVGGVTTNSYVTLEEAEAYFTDRLHASQWTTFTEKESALITASRLLDWELKFQGFKTDSAQAMQFPRTGVVLSDGSDLSETIIPQEVKFAVFELALKSLISDRTADSSLSGIEQVKAGPLFVKATPAGVDSTQSKTVPDYIRKLLAEYLISGNMSVVRLMRA